MKRYLHTVFLIVFSFATYAADVHPNPDKNEVLLDVIQKYFDNIKFDFSEFAIELAGDSVSPTGEDEISKFNEILRNFVWQIKTEQFLESGFAKKCLVGASLSGGISYIASSLAEFVPGPLCEDWWILDGVKSYVICKIPRIEDSVMTGVTLRPGIPAQLFSLPVAVGNYAAIALGVGAGVKCGYDFYLKYSLNKLAKINYDDTDSLFTNMVNYYSTHKNVISFMYQYLVEKDEQAHTLWSEKDRAHQKRSYFYALKSKAE